MSGVFSIGPASVTGGIRKQRGRVVMNYPWKGHEVGVWEACQTTHILHGARQLFFWGAVRGRG